MKQMKAYASFDDYLEAPESQESGDHPQSSSVCGAAPASAAMTRLFPCLLLSIGLTAAGHAQVVRDSSGVTEFIGLSSWTPARIVDTLRRLAPGQPIHQCAAILKGQLGFPEASVTYYSQEGVEGVLVVTVLEPRDSALVRYNLRPNESLRISSAWSRLAARADSEFRLLDLALLTWRYAAMPADSAAPLITRFGSSPDSIVPFWSLIRRAGTKETAMQLLSRDSSAARRRAAVASLIRFPSDPAVWRVLVRTLRDPDEVTGIVAARVLEQFTNYSPRPVDWASEVESIRAILVGTRLFHFPLLVRVLNTTGVDPVLGPQLLGNGGHLLLDYATAELAPVRADARQLLRRLTQTDAAADGQAWRDWIAAQSRQ
jgi:hypothetical protein